MGIKLNIPIIYYSIRSMFYKFMSFCKFVVVRCWDFLVLFFRTRRYETKENEREDGPRYAVQHIFVLFFRTQINKIKGITAEQERKNI